MNLDLIEYPSMAWKAALSWSDGQTRGGHFDVSGPGQMMFYGETDFYFRVTRTLEVRIRVWQLVPGDLTEFWP